MTASVHRVFIVPLKIQPALWFVYENYRIVAFAEAYRGKTCQWLKSVSNVQCVELHDNTLLVYPQLEMARLAAFLGAEHLPTALTMVSVINPEPCKKRQIEISAG